MKPHLIPREVKIKNLLLPIKLTMTLIKMCKKKKKN